VLLLILVPAVAWVRAQLSTEDHMSDPGFWPTEPAAARSDFAGPEACRQCHEAKFDTQMRTDMGRAIFPASQSAALHSHSHLTFDVGKYHYLIQTTAKGSMYSVTTGTEMQADPLLWAFGRPRVGQSYLFKKPDGKFYEARVTYFPGLKNLQFTPSRALASPKDLDEAMDRQVPPAEVQRCFACHTTASTIGDRLDEEHLIPGVTCEACHGPGAKHVANMKDLMAGKLDARQGDIYNSAHLSPNDAVDFCGACHGTWWDVKISGTHGPSTTRSAPYRLVTSKCWGTKGDARLVCTACHDPHVQLQTQASAYDHACLRCHLSSASAAPVADHPGKACPVGVKNCSSCHMPKVNVPEMQDDFTDHRIRIAHAGEPFPE
jgi:hypothetical protein